MTAKNALVISDARLIAGYVILRWSRS